MLAGMPNAAAIDALPRITGLLTLFARDTSARIAHFLARGETRCQAAALQRTSGTG
jgi:hypothetical protein